MLRPGRISSGYIAVLGGVLAVSIAASWLPLAKAIDGDAYDWLSQLHPPALHRPESVVVAIDEQTLKNTGGMRRIRATVADMLDLLRPAAPAAVALDLVLADDGDPADDRALEDALGRTSNVVLSTDIARRGENWEDPLPRFAAHAAAIGHVHAHPDPVCRVLPLEKISGHRRRWALALEAFRLYRGEGITESPDVLDIGNTEVPTGRRSDGRPLYLRYAPLPVLSAWDLRTGRQQLEAVRGRAVFIGVTALTAANDRLLTPSGETMSGVEIHANAFNTLAGGEFLEPVSAAFALLAPVLLVGAAAAAFALLSGWPAYLAGGGIIIASHVIPHIAFRQGFVFPYTAPVMAAWLGVGTAAAWQYFVVRRQLWKSESDKARYQQAIHFVTHEMRSPLTAIQGSSELIGRYNLNEDKRKQVAEMINSESRRLARMIQTFLDIERLTDGQMELRSESFDVAGLIATCTKRAQALADRKGIELESGVITELSLTGDRELMEYALYNLLTNAVKYSPANTRVRVEAHGDASSVRVSVQDQGIGLEPQELKSIFKKFYRTRKAEASGEAGTGIGLSLVEQIVDHHGGRMDVTSAPGKGSCFTMVLPRSKNAPVVPASTTVSS